VQPASDIRSDCLVACGDVVGELSVTFGACFLAIGIWFANPHHLGIEPFSGATASAVIGALNR
jgi:hypothetical protein